MSVALYMDVHIPRAITEALRLNAVDVLTAQEDDADRLSDEQILERAHVLGRVLFTFDDDLVAIAAVRQKAGVPFAGLIYARPMSISVGACIQDLEIVARAADPEDTANLVQFLPLAKR